MSSLYTLAERMVIKCGLLHWRSHEKGWVLLFQRVKDRFVLPTFRSECSDLLQGEDETTMRHLSLYSLASHQVLSPELSVGATCLWLDTLPVFFNAAIQHLGSSRPSSLLRDG